MNGLQEDVLLGKIPVPAESETLTDKTNVSARKANNTAFEDLLLLIDGEQASGRVAFNIVRGAKTSDLTDGDAALAWKRLLESTCGPASSMRGKIEKLGCCHPITGVTFILYILFIDSDDQLQHLPLPSCNLPGTIALSKQPYGQLIVALNSRSFWTRTSDLICYTDFLLPVARAAKLLTMLESTCGPASSMRGKVEELGCCHPITGKSLNLLARRRHFSPIYTLYRLRRSITTSVHSDKRLSDKYEPKSAPSRLALKNEFNTKILKNANSDPDAWLMELEDLRVRLIAAGSKMDDDELLEHVLNSAATDPLTIEDVRSALNLKYQRLTKGKGGSNNSSSDDGHETALFAGGFKASVRRKMVVAVRITMQVATSSPVSVTTARKWDTVHTNVERRRQIKSESEELELAFMAGDGRATSNQMHLWIGDSGNSRHLTG
ncbi:hypothetical protein G9A89_021666, partial [Geosiphon pyriformis]